MTAIRKIKAISPIDRLGALRAQIAELKATEAFLIDEVKALGLGAHEGDLFRATISETAEALSLDPKAAEAKLIELGVDGRWFSRHQKVRAGSVAVRIVARKGV
jgi:hypothetical protein